MSTDPKCSPNGDRFQFSMRTLLIVVTAACLLFGVLTWVIPRDLPISMRITTYGIIAAAIAFGVLMGCRAKRHPWKTPINYVTVKVDAKWKRRVESPFIMMPIGALTGVSLTFAPLFLWQSGQGDFGSFQWIAVPLCFVIIYFVPGFYIALACEVLAELHKSDSPST